MSGKQKALIYPLLEKILLFWWKKTCL